MLEIVPSNRFKRDLRLIKKRGLKIDNLRNVIDTLAGEKELDEKHRDHASCILGNMTMKTLL